MPRYGVTCGRVILILTSCDRKAAKTHQLDASKVLEKFTAQSAEEIPAVELHMFPEDPLQLNSTWMTLIVPKSKELFGKTFYLCRPPEENKQQCVAELTFFFGRGTGPWIR